MSLSVVTGPASYNNLATKPRQYVTLAAVRALLVLLMLLCPMVASAEGPPAKLTMRELALMTRATKDLAAVNRRVRLGVPRGWTGDRHPNGRSLELVGPKGEGRILVAAALHPDELSDYLGELKRRHPSAAPSPPEHMTLPGVDPTRGERATRFVITGREVGEMVLIEKANTIVLIVTVVDPQTWETVKSDMSKVYPTVAITDAESKPPTPSR